MATLDFETLRARVQALGCQLFMDDSVDGTKAAASLGEDGPRFYIHDPQRDRHIIIGTGLDIEEWIVEQEGHSRAHQLARGRVPVEGTTDGENGLYLEATQAERREAIRKLGDAAKALGEVMGTLHSIKAIGEVLVQDTVRDNDAWVLGLGQSVVEQAGVMLDFLDRAGGWPSGDKA